MVELLLQERYRATAADAASQALEAAFGTGTATVDGPGELDFELRSLVDDGISFTSITSSGRAMTVRLAEAPDLLAFTVRTGLLQYAADGRSTTVEAGQLAVIPIGRSAELRWRDLTLDVFSFPTSTVARLLGSEPGRVLLHAARVTATSPALTALWLRTGATLAGEVLRHRELYESDVIREQAIAALLGVTIEAFGISNVQEDDEAPAANVLDAADAYMRDHLAESISVVNIARAAGLSVRGLQLAYSRKGAGTPIARLRELRMIAAQDLLLEPGTDRTGRIGGVARRLGYTNLGRFSAHYREHFGETPGETLKRSMLEGERV